MELNMVPAPRKSMTEGRVEMPLHEFSPSQEF